MNKGIMELMVLESLHLVSPRTLDERKQLIDIFEAAKESEEELDLEDALDEGKKDMKVKERDEEAVIDDEDTPANTVKAKAINNNKYTIQVLLKVYDKLLQKLMNSNLPTETIENSAGDIKKLGKLTKDKTYYEVFKTMLDTHRPVAEGFGGGESKYFEIFEKFLHNVEKYSPKFKAAYKKKKENLVKVVYISSVMYLVEMTAILSSCTIHIFNKGAKNFDKLLEETKEFVSVFEHASKLYDDKESDIPKFMTQDISISESAIVEWFNSVDNLEEIDPKLMDLAESAIRFNSTSSKQIGLAHIAKLLKYGLSITMYKLFSVVRYIMYIIYYQKFNMARKIQLISASLDLVESTGDVNQRNENRSISTQSSIEYRADVIKSTNSALNDSNINDGKDAIDF